MQKKIIYIFILFMLVYCKKYEAPKDEIINHYLNKSLVGISKDSINISCYPSIFAIERNSNTGKDSLSAFIKGLYDTANSDCFIQFAVENTGDFAKILAENTSISDSSIWGNKISAICLDHFKGKGINFIGYRCATITPDGIYFRYGWLKIEINSNANSLKIYNWATNNTINRSILAGQMY